MGNITSDSSIVNIFYRCSISTALNIYYSAHPAHPSGHSQLFKVIPRQFTVSHPIPANEGREKRHFVFVNPIFD